jgi:hypothetical protein
LYPCFLTECLKFTIAGRKAEGGDVRVSIQWYGEAMRAP